jgi:hypothetical protein
VKSRFLLSQWRICPLGLIHLLSPGKQNALRCAASKIPSCHIDLLQAIS